MHQRDGDASGGSIGVGFASAAGRSTSTVPPPVRTAFSATRFPVEGGVGAIRDELLLAWLLRSYRSRDESLADFTWRYIPGVSTSPSRDHVIHIDELAISESGTLAAALRTLREHTAESSTGSYVSTSSDTLVLSSHIPNTKDQSKTQPSRPGPFVSTTAGDPLPTILTIGS